MIGMIEWQDMYYKFIQAKQTGKSWGKLLIKNY